MIDWILQPWPWYVAGPGIVLIMFLLLYMGGEFGVSSSFRTICAVAGGNRFSDFFQFNWKTQLWNVVFAVGILLGGIIASNWMMTPGHTPALAADAIASLQALGIHSVQGMLPAELFGTENMLTPKGFALLTLGGFLVGFGARYAGGCTSGHAISGLSNLQLPSLLAVLGFFAGGLITTYFILPLLF
jgi:hypothetical protein